MLPYICFGIGLFRYLFRYIRIKYIPGNNPDINRTVKNFAFLGCFLKFLREARGKFSSVKCTDVYGSEQTTKELPKFNVIESILIT